MKVRFAVALATIAGAFFVLAPSAFAAPITKTLNFPLSGTSSTNIFDEPFSCCGIHIGSPIDYTGDIHGGLKLDLGTSMSAPSHNDLTFTDTNLRQGKTLDLTNTFTNDSGSLDVEYTLSGSLDVYPLHFELDKSASDTLSCGLPLLADTCSHDKNIDLFHLDVFDIVTNYVTLDVSAVITTTAEINGDGVASHRTLTVSGQDIKPPADLTFTSSPEAKDESTLLSCSLPANETVNYAMGDPSSHITGTVTEGLGIGVGGSVWQRDIPPLPDFVLFSIGPENFDNLITLPDVAFNQIDLSAAGQNTDLGVLQANNIAPTVAMDTIPQDGTEGAPIQLGVKGTGPGGSMSPCGDDSLDVHWSFDDGGSAFGKTVHHAWADNFLGNPSPPHTGQVVITDPTGLKTTLNFSVPVANVPPTVDAGPNKTQLWGVPVLLHGNGTDQGSTDDPILTYLWGFGDPNSPLGAAGQDVSHVYGMPGDYVAQVTVTDNDGVQGTDTVDVSILKRGTTLSYTGPLSSNPSKDVTLTASLVDELNQPVSGRTVVFTLGSQITSAATNASGVATATMKLNQKQGAYAVSASFAEDAKYLGDSDSRTFTIGPK